MIILARVCADFYDKDRNLIHRIRPADLGLFQEAPDSIKQDPLFQMLVDDGSIKFPEDAAKNKALEQDPFAGATPDGRDIQPKAEKPRTETKPKIVTKSPVKTEAKAEEKSVDKSEDSKTK